MCGSVFKRVRESLTIAFLYQLESALFLSGYIYMGKGVMVEEI
jgi:hypothetical protein